MSNNKDHQDENKVWRYIGIAVIVLIFLVGINRFGFTGRTDGIRTGGNSLGDIALEYYFEKYPEQAENEDIEARVKNFGCHKEIHIYNEGTQVMRMSYFNGQMYELE
ncbi:hypothetical protein [Alkaliphilus peptidifermentans]|uniref:Uncharacterized protein n=1 Tax=Alkaliphilus peptidifermentans DSM 18978 TaxID=1120976 RepID=A0A1G5G2F5_9FIRM|nr:hypothetical protein [Alkaliphilus peptidifermentans]SCY45517.1 hypothetical protein SAMN03080606_01577 [Alkaliphilus peptidifermentans DSM 18978]